ncbi:unnamed protein product [Rhizoctonia solani]|uniref:Uncharacterized protein n=1 Tax=Rhizoctonia solani TaxID=456999 RepID=A0A8H3BZ72_9AGAM|nr:unnamed protein product [Rhizoctonia solani]
MNWMEICKLNAKDAFIDMVKCSKSSEEFLSIAGRRRKRTILHRRIMSVSGHGIHKFFYLLLFRRISPVETKGYALARNSFAVLAMGALIFRAITALVQAQDKISTRFSSRECGMFPDASKIQIFVQFGSTASKGSDQNIGVEVLVESNKTIVACKQEITFTKYPQYSPFSLRLYTCTPRSAESWPPEPRIYHITTHSTDGSDLSLDYMPLVWLVEKGGNLNGTAAGGAGPYYTVPWKLNPGYHTEAEARLISRGFITSSMWRDLVLNSSPEYTYISLYPIDVSATQPLQNATTATARIHATLKPGIKYLQDKTAFNAINSGDTNNVYASTGPGDYYWSCDFVEDYRSGTVLDILGSVGGLFAILQTLHVLLFGRPLFWGLMGTKSLNPFGLLSSFGSDGFKHRLYETYGREPTKDNPDWIQTAAFLRDFVIDFGPLEARPNQDQESMQAIPVANRTGTTDSRA